MATLTKRFEVLHSQLRSIDSDLSNATAAISSVESRIARVEGGIGNLQSRLLSVRGRGYHAMSHLEKSTELLNVKWLETGPMIKQSFVTNVQPLMTQICGLQGEAQRLRSIIGRSDFGAASLIVGTLSVNSSSIRSRANSEAARVNATLNPLIENVDAIDRDLKIAESTILLFSQASFGLKPEEGPVLAVTGKLMVDDKSSGTLYFTNHRFIFEGKREVVLERKLFIATKKKTERTVMIEQPIGALQEISKGRVGLIAWTGVYIRFKPELALQETPFDVEGWEAEAILRFFNYIIGGEADRDIAQARGTAASQVSTVQVVRCPHCGAPYTQELYKGQSSVKCEYCGSQIRVQ